jgi:hypothetical protein
MSLVPFCFDALSAHFFIAWFEGSTGAQTVALFESGITDFKNDISYDPERPPVAGEAAVPGGLARVIRLIV